MKRHISIFTFLLSAFAAVGVAGSATAFEYYASSTHPFTITDYDGEDLKFDKYNKESGGYYHVNNEDYGITDLSINRGDHITANIPAGYKFNGWYTKTGGWNGQEAFISEANERLTENQAIDGATIEDKAQKFMGRSTIVAKYEIITFDVTFECNGGTPSSIAKIEGKTIDTTIALPSVSKDGYEFAGWKNAKGKLFPAGDTSGKAFWDDTDRKFYADLTAQWTGKTYSITLDRDGGTGGSCPDTYTVSESSQGLEITPPTKEGHTIQGWTVSGATGVTPTVAGSPLTLTIPANTYGNLTLKPKWTADTFTITYKPGKNCTPGDEYTDTKTWDVSKALRDKTYADPKGQYVQDGWNTNDESFEGEPDYGLKAAYMDNADITLFPHWKLNGYKLTIHHKGAYYDGKLLEETALESLVVGTTNLNEILVAVPTNGAAFYGYYSTEGGSTQIYDEHGKCCNVEGVWSGAWPNGTFAGNANLEVWAKWGPPPDHCTIRAVCNPAVGGTVEPASTNVVKGRDVTLTATKNNGYSFCCWTNSNGVVVSEKPEYSFTVTADATYTAVFTGNVYTVTFYGNGGDPDEQVRAYTHGSAYGEFPEVDRNGYDFVGWFTSAGKSGTLVTEDELFLNVDDDGELFAHWTEKTEFKAVFIDKDDKNGAITNQVRKGDIISEAPAKTASWTRKYYTLSGWNPTLPQTVGASDLEFTAVWWSIGKDVLDCTNLDFEASGNWKPFADPDAVGGLCMRTDVLGGSDNLTATLKESGTLTFHWKGNVGRVLNVKLGNVQTNFTFKGSVWQEETIPVVIDSSAPVELNFTWSDPWVYGDFCAIDHVTWAPGAKPVETYAVTFNPNGGSVTPAPKVVTYGEAYGELPTLDDREDYKFAGWTLVSGDTVTAETIVKTAADHELIAKWTQDLGPASEALDCTNLVFTMSGGWAVRKDEGEVKFAKEGGSCLISSTKNATVLTEISESGELKFFWKCQGYEGVARIKAYTNNVEITSFEMFAGDEGSEWKSETLTVNGPVTLVFKCTAMPPENGYCALDYVIWTPSGSVHPEPVDGEDNVTISSAAVSDGKFSLSFQSDERFDYNLLTNANLLINSWGIMETLVGDGNILTFEPIIIKGQPQLFYKVETIQKK